MSNDGMANTHLVGRRQFIAYSAAAASSIMLFGLAGCSSPKQSGFNDSQHYKAGTYTAQATGKKGPVTVEVTFSDSAIDSVKVTDSLDTPRISGVAFKTIPEEIVQYQSLGVDTVSGATLSSWGVINATKDCVKQAGGNVSALEKAPAAEKKTDVDESEADIVVIGAGAAGMPMALESAINGAKVTVFEKCSSVGGNALVSGGVLGYIDAPDELRQDTNDGYRNYFAQTLEKAKGIGVPQDKIDEVQKQFDDWYASGKTKLFDSVEWQCLYSIIGSGATEYSEEQYETFYSYLEKDADLMQWLNQFNIGYKKLIAVAGYPWPNNTSPSTGECGEGYFAAFDKYMEQNNLPIDILFATPATELLTDETGAVTGVKGVCEDGTTYVVKAKKGVVLATGGFAGNPDLLREHDDEWGLADVKNIPTTNNFGHTGDGLKMALAVGGSFVEASPNYMVLPFANAIDQSVESIVGDSGNALLVSSEGKRFVDESRSRNEISKAQMALPDQMCYLISDKNNSLINGEYNLFGTNVQQLLDNGKLFKADTLEELADIINIDSKTLVDTVKQYNEYAKAGVDPDFGRTMFTETSPVVEGPFYANPCSWAMHITNAGIGVDFDTCSVLNQNGEPIKGLYAIGECVPTGGGIDVMSYGVTLADMLTA